MSTFQIAGGIAFIIIGLNALGVMIVPSVVVGVVAIIAGIALLVGK